jgi:REP element-mobilizing transposase RayT
MNKNALQLIPSRYLLALMEFPSRLFHWTPTWVEDAELFHIRIRTSVTQALRLTDPAISAALITSAQKHHGSARWTCTLFLLMPDHLHTLLRFPREPGMSETIRHWKRGCARLQFIRWQDGYFDHRLRSNEEAQATFGYILNNPVVKGLCSTAETWPYKWNARVDTRSVEPAP